MLKMLKKLMLIKVKYRISILDFNFFHMDPPAQYRVDFIMQIGVGKDRLKILSLRLGFANNTCNFRYSRFRNLKMKKGCKVRKLALL